VEVNLFSTTYVLTLCCDRKARAACAQSFTLCQQARIEITRRDHSSRVLVVTFNRSHVSIGRACTPRTLYYCLFAPHIYRCCSSRTLRSWWIAHSAQRQRSVCNSCMTDVFENSWRTFHQKATVFQSTILTMNNGVENAMWNTWTGCRRNIF